MLLVRPFLLLAIGLNVRHRDRLPQAGPAIVVANHNSHLDTLVLMCLFPQRRLDRLCAVAAADYFLARRWLAWFATEIIGIVPLERRPKAGRDPLAGIDAALEAGRVVIFFPEGTRGTPEQMATLRTGIAHVVRRHPDVPVVPVFLHGLGKALPKGEALLVPFFCDVFVGEPLPREGARRAFMDRLDQAFRALSAEAKVRPWA